ncbi:sigma-54-dependent Fis family transcriptional regulator [Undibacterium flavidum]|uniref:Sigma-54-dependent Fis family transcriptional regulator n=1 Tax=Undibacterium flavidum TaxID=2762297 RepID=A0ABR6Y9P5_9BURK|nr:sigma-54-dependent Fis family transcriptional regulator [Undibacterium flavidum]MBC3873335.1 sigma-54-dependent Fis family transcriptional regulator [Undibacterium flavidum]
MRQHAILTAPHLKQARLQFVERGIRPETGVELRVAQSWQRSMSAGLSPLGGVDCADNLSVGNLRYARDLNHELISHSEPVIEYLFEQLRHSHSMVILADAQGVLMHTMGDLDFLSKADKVALKCGASWAENQRGTNAIGTALAEASEIEINGAEHFLEPNEFLTCAAAPILSAQGQLMGILDISGDHRSRHPHTLGLVTTAAQMIENSLVLSACQHQILVQLHTSAAGIGSVAQGVLAFSEDGCLVGANRRGLALLKLRYTDIAATRWEHLFEQDFEALLARQLRLAGRAEAVFCRDGTCLFVQMHSQSRGRQAMTVSVQSTQTQPLRSAQSIQSGQIDARWQAASEKARKLIDKAIPLLITGESGVGKEVFAQSVHQASARRDKAFVAVNCAAIPEHLIEAELFGYVAGAFTGAARQGAAGRLREAHGGTLFLDEIGDMPFSLQTRLLRVLQERQVIPLGSSVAIAVDFNLICATHQNLKRNIEQGRFREDLFYRINGLSLNLPALRERSDFTALCASLLREFSPVQIDIAIDLLAAMRVYAWPGNLRQLSHVLRAAVALMDEEQSCISWEHIGDELAAELRNASKGNPRLESAAIAELERRDAVEITGKIGETPTQIPQNAWMNSMPQEAKSPSKAQNLQENARQLIQQALQNTNGNVSAAARLLGISRQTLYRKLQGQ